MDEIDKNTLAVAYACGIDGINPADAMAWTFRPSEIEARLDKLKREGMLDADARLTKTGRAAIRVVLTGGVFDILHPGHAQMLATAKALGDVLVVVVATDDMAWRMKKKTPRHSKEERRDLVDLLEIVDLCCVGTKGHV